MRILGTFVLFLIWVLVNGGRDSAVVVKDEAVDDFNRYTHEFLKRMVWASSCRSRYKQGDADSKVISTYAGSILHFKGMLSFLMSCWI